MAEVTEEVELKPCCNPGCDQLGTKACSACKTSSYCSVSCQTANWPSHRAECDGHLRKVGIANLDKSDGFERERNWAQALRFAEIAATKLKKLKDRRLETVILINNALVGKFNALNNGYLGRQREAKECAEERYTLWAMNHLRNPGSIRAALTLIDSCIYNEEYEDAEHYSRHAMFMINEMTDNFIPSDQQPWFLAEASYHLSQSILFLSKPNDISPEEKQKVGKEAIELARQALKLRTQLHGTESSSIAYAMILVADNLNYFNDVDDDESLRLHEQSIAIIGRLEGRSSLNVTVGERNLGVV